MRTESQRVTLTLVGATLLLAILSGVILPLLMSDGPASLGAGWTPPESPVPASTSTVAAPPATATALPTATDRPPTATRAPAQSPTAAAPTATPSPAPSTATMEPTSTAEPTRTPAATPTQAEPPPPITPIAATGQVTVRAAVVNLRAGPGTTYPVLRTAQAGEQFAVVGRSADGAWWQICCINEAYAWIADEVVDAEPAEPLPSQ